MVPSLPQTSSLPKKSDLSFINLFILAYFYRFFSGLGEERKFKRSFHDRMVLFHKGGFFNEM